MRYIMGLVENNISQNIRLAISKFTSATMFRNNVGTAWTGDGKPQRTQDGGMYLKNPRPFHAGLCTGSSDLIGFNSIEVTPEMVGKKIAIFTAVEVKTQSGRASKEQLLFIAHVKRMGGIAGIAKSENEAVNLINNFIK